MKKSWSQWNWQENSWKNWKRSWKKIKHMWRSCQWQLLFLLSKTGVEDILNVLFPGNSIALKFGLKNRNSYAKIVKGKHSRQEWYASNLYSGLPEVHKGRRWCGWQLTKPLWLSLEYWACSYPLVASSLHLSPFSIREIKINKNAYPVCQQDRRCPLGH